MTKKKAIILLSGGLDSATVLQIALRDSFEVVALTIDYGQLHRREIEHAEQLARFFKVQHLQVQIPMPWRGSALLDHHIALPKNRDEREMAQEIPATYVPARNTVFLSLAASFAESVQADAIFIGANAIDYSGYPDCRPEFLEAFERVLKLGTKRGVEGRAIKIEAPLLRLKKGEIVKLGLSLGVPFEWTWSCYQGGAVPCGACDSCKLRAKGFEEAKTIDPLLQMTVEGNQS